MWRWVVNSIQVNGFPAIRKIVCASNIVSKVEDNGTVRLILFQAGKLITGGRFSKATVTCGPDKPAAKKLHINFDCSFHATNLIF